MLEHSKSCKKTSGGSVKNNQQLSDQEAYDYAVKLLSVRDYSSRSMEERLQRKGISPEAARECVRKLREYRYIDDERYALQVYTYWLEKKSYGRRHLLAELLKRGVVQENIAKVLNQFTTDNEREHAEQAAELFCLRNKKKIDREERRKIYAAAVRFMATRGFSTDLTVILLSKLGFLPDI